jgi:hypothetical protein
MNTWDQHTFPLRLLGLLRPPFHPQRFAQSMETTMQRVLGNSKVKLHVEVVTNLWNFQDWLGPLGSGLKHITIVEHGEDVNHLFRFIARRDIYNYRVHERPFSWIVRNTNRAETKHYAVKSVCYRKQGTFTISRLISVEGYVSMSTYVNPLGIHGKSECTTFFAVAHT